MPNMQKSKEYIIHFTIGYIREFESMCQKRNFIFFVPHRHQSKPIDRQKRGLPQNVGQTSENIGARLQAKDENTACGADDRRRYADLSCCLKETSSCKAADARRRLSASHL